MSPFDLKFEKTKTVHDDFEVLGAIFGFFGQKSPLVQIRPLYRV